MNRELDLSMQRIIDGAASNSGSRLERTFNYTSPRSQPAPWSFAQPPRQAAQDPMLLNEIGRDSYTHEPPRQPLPAMLNHGQGRAMREPFAYDATHHILPASNHTNPRQEHEIFAYGGQQESVSGTVNGSASLARNISDLGSGDYNSSRQGTAEQSTATAPARLSLAPYRSIYGQQQRDEPRSVSNADHHFKFAQNLRQGAPMNQTQQRVAVQQGESPLSQLATNMIMQRPMQKASADSMGFAQNRQHDRVLELQPAKQQVTPPFNLSGFRYGNSGPSKFSTSSSSPPHSSAAARASQRRTTHRATIPTEYVPETYEQGDEFDDEDQTAQPITPQAQKAALTDDVFYDAARISHSVPKSTVTLSLAHAPPIVRGIQLIHPHELPDRFRHVFPYELFNASQSKCFPAIYKTTDNVVVSAPTGSGKTVLLELAICKLVDSHNSGEFKIVYMAPTKSLCAERVKDWSKKFSHLNLPCAELTGDTTQSEMKKVRGATIIVTTPEKWDSITRQLSDHQRLTQMVKLFLIDEVHMLKKSRGATLEVVVSRMNNPANHVRFIALSATVPNSHDIAVWLGKNSTNPQTPALRETFGEDFRPVKLQKHVHGFDGTPNDFAFDKVLDSKLPGLIKQYTHKKPIMVFCFTRNSCESTATMLAEWWLKQRDEDRAWPAPSQKTVVGSRELQDLVNVGVAFHHAGLELPDRNAVEAAYLKGDISLICCTSTLAVGVNLPCHLVVLKGTVGYQDNGLEEFSDLEVMQMLGRAGRPQFDDSAVAIIMTRKDKIEKYTKMVSGQDILESTLHLNLIEHLNSEICLGTIKNLHGAKEWLKKTFLIVRMRQNPDYYKFEGIPFSRDATPRLQNICERDVKLLQENGLVEGQGSISSTLEGEAMSKYMVNFETMKLLLSLPEKSKTEQILSYICQASEFKELRIKPNERPILRELNKSPLIKYPIKEAVTLTAHKVSLMIQVQLGGVDLPETKEFAKIRRQYVTEKGIIFDRIQRLIRCFIDCRSGNSDAISTRYGLDLARSLSAEFWENSSLQLRQIPSVGPVATNKLIAAGIRSIEQLASKDSASLERILSRNPPFGTKVLDTLKGFPLLTLTSEIIGNAQRKPGDNPAVNVRVCAGYTNKQIPVWYGSKPALTFTAETSDGTLVHYWRGNIHKLERGLEMRFDAKLSRPGDTITSYIACDNIVGTFRSSKVTSTVPASAFPVLKSKPQVPQVAQSNFFGVEDEYGGDELEEDDFLAAVRSVTAPPPAPESEYGSDEFADIDEILETNHVQEKETETRDEVESVKMENGRWTCNHACSGGGLLKTGQPCKHKCCKAGLDKPPKTRVRERSSYGTGELPASLQPTGKLKSNQKPTKKVIASSKSTDTSSSNGKTCKPAAKQLRMITHKQGDLDDVEVVDLAEGKPTPTYAANFAPREFRKLHKLHTGIQEDKPLRVFSQSPRLPNTNAQKTSNLINSKPKVVDDPFDDEFDNFDDIEDLPPLSHMLETRKALGNTAPLTPSNHAAESSIQEDSMESIEAAMLGLPDPTLPRHRSLTPIPRVNSSFANGVFDFEGYEGKPDDDGYSSPPMRDTTRKRVRSPTLAKGVPSPVKFRRMNSDEFEDVFGDETQEEMMSPIEKVVQSQEKKPEQQQPGWFGDLGMDMLEGFKDLIDFTD